MVPTAESMWRLHPRKVIERLQQLAKSKRLPEFKARFPIEETEAQIGRNKIFADHLAKFPDVALVIHEINKAVGSYVREYLDKKAEASG